jgi:hypothetical protein
VKRVTAASLWSSVVARRKSRELNRKKGLEGAMTRIACASKLQPNCFVYSTPKHALPCKSLQPWRHLHDKNTKSRVIK